MTKNVKRICLTAVFMALVCISTMFFKVPIPLGYAHLGNGFILLGCFYMGNPSTIAIGGIGSCLADLLGGFPEWILPTLIIKSLMGFSMGLIMKKNALFSIRTLLASISAIIIMVAGYFISGTILYGSAVTSATQLPGLISEGIIGIILFYILGAALNKAHFTKLLNMD